MGHGDVQRAPGGIADQRLGNIMDGYVCLSDAFKSERKRILVFAS